MNAFVRGASRRALPVYDELRKFELEGVQASSCRAGCAHCCHLLVQASLIEAVIVAVHVLERTEDTRTLEAALEERCQELASLVAEFGDDRALLNQRYFDANLRCLFLTADNRCSIYSVRPIACRLHFVRSDPSLCSHEARGAQTETFDVGELPFRILARMLSLSDRDVPPLFGAFFPQLKDSLALLRRSRRANDGWRRRRQGGSESVDLQMAAEFAAGRRTRD